MTKFTLPQKKEFLLNLVNNNYSQRTLEGYARDLLIFELFLQRYEIPFQKLSKLNINEYKGYLRNAQHLEDLDGLKALERQKTKAISEDLPEQDKKVEFTGKENIVLEKALGTDVLRKTRSKGSRTHSKHHAGLKGSSINRMLSAIRSYLAFLIDMDEKVPIAPESIKLVKTEKRESQVAEFDQLVELIEAPEQYESRKKIRYRNRAILELLFSTGMRISELVSLDIDDLKYDPERNAILDNKIYVLGKGKKQRYVYLTDRCINYLQRYLKIREDDFPALFIPYRGSRKAEDEPASVRISQRYVQSMIKRYRKLLGILIPTTPHSLRHGFATYLAEKGANPAAIQRLLGHESLQTTTRYVHSSDKFAEKSHHKFHPLGED
ncbi:tyrosine-type recombinase/integrase [Candidatus Dojkabacteria bacterium]|nr:tyrosine-type recombinase/integrase [Candidatus Dojkabacteria bacterium]